MYIIRTYLQFKIKMKDKFLEYCNFKIQDIMMVFLGFNKEIVNKNLLLKFLLLMVLLKNAMRTFLMISMFNRYLKQKSFLVLIFKQFKMYNYLVK